MWRILILVVFSLVAGCAGTTDRVKSPRTMAEPDCPSGQIPFVEDDHYYCVDERVFEPEDCWPCGDERDPYRD